MISRCKMQDGINGFFFTLFVRLDSISKVYSCHLIQCNVGHKTGYLVLLKNSLLDHMKHTITLELTKQRN